VYRTPAGILAVDPVLGDNATVTLACHFEPLTALSALFVGDDVVVGAETVFPMRYGCIDCPAPSPPSAPPPPPDLCRLIPHLAGMSVAGARLAWESAGFSAERFTPITGDDGATVDEFFVTEDDPDSNCEAGYAVFSSSVVVTLLEPDLIVGSCVTVPNLTGTIVADARQTWTDAGFSAPDFSPPDQDTRVVTDQTTDPESTPGVSCLDPDTTTITVAIGDAWPDAPPAPCQVPNLIDKTRPEAAVDWDIAGFSGDNFQPPVGAWKVKWQSLVGGDWVSCDSSVTVSQKP